MKKIISLVFYAVLAAGPLYLFTAYSSGAPQGYTGSPGDNNQNCTACHTAGTAYNPTIEISGFPATGYTPDSVYDLHLAVSGANNPRTGFEICMENASHQKAGVFHALNNQTQTLSSGHYITHTSQGISRHAWDFRWTAPSAGQGDLTLYYAINLANGDNNSTGDDIHTGTVQVPLAQTAVEKWNRDQFRVYPVPAGDVLYYESRVGRPEHMEVVDASGKIFLVPFAHGRMDISSLPAGMYRIRIKAGKRYGTVGFLKE
ncbi:MAG: T9SS type A sorting domain-containing protein [Chlorobi bacterium]|nr:T9SS type A sorting domain-containing protein [Chlorobiota bacterium]